MSAKARILAFVITAHVLLTIGHGQTAPLFHFIEKPGPYPVGLRVVEQYDYSRIYHSTTDDLGKPLKASGRVLCRHSSGIRQRRAREKL